MKEEIVDFNSEGQKTVGILHTPDIENPPAIILVHGYGGYIFTKRFEFIASELCKAGYAVLRFMFRGYDIETGERSILDFKNLTIHGEIADLKAAIDFMSNKGYKKIGIAAESLGSNITILLNDNRIRALAFWSTNIHIRSAFEITYGKEIVKELEEKGHAIYISQTTGNKFDISKKFWDEVKNIGDNPDSEIREVKCPMLIMHGTNDEYFNVKVAQDLYKLANQPKKLIVIDGANHTFLQLESQKKLISYILDWFKTWLK